MDSLELLVRLGQVEPADQAVLDGAVDRFAEAVSRGDQSARFTVRPKALRRPALIGAAAAVTLAVVLSLVLAGNSAATSRTAGSFPARHGLSRQPAAESGRAAHVPRQGSSVIPAVLTAFSANSGDILQVSKIVTGEGTCCRYKMWISPLDPAPGATVRSRIQAFTVGGSRLADQQLTYAAPATSPASGTTCGEAFGRPRVVQPPEPGLAGMLTEVNYPGRVWTDTKVRVSAATVPGTGGMRACLDSGQWRVLGKASLQGTRAIELISSNATQRLWVSAATFLPVRLVSVTPTPYGPVTITFGFRFLAATAANRARLMPPAIPAGFTRIAIPG
jgi:hypothetical protein